MNHTGFFTHMWDVKKFCQNHKDACFDVVLFLEINYIAFSEIVLCWLQRIPIRLHLSIVLLLAAYYNND